MKQHVAVSKRSQIAVIRHTAKYHALNLCFAGITMHAWQVLCIQPSPMIPHHIVVARTYKKWHRKSTKPGDKKGCLSLQRFDSVGARVKEIPREANDICEALIVGQPRAGALIIMKIGGM